MLRVPAAMPLPSTAAARGAPDLGDAPGTWRLKSVAQFVEHAKCPTASLTSLLLHGGRFEAETAVTAETSPARWLPLPDMNGHTGVTANTNAGRAGRNGKGREIRQKQAGASAAVTRLQRTQTALCVGTGRAPAGRQSERVRLSNTSPNFRARALGSLGSSWPTLAGTPQHKPTFLAAYSACATVNLLPASEESCSISPWHENDDVLRYCLAAFTACSFQFTCRCSTAKTASWCGNLLPASEESCSISPASENADVWRYCSAARNACC